MSDGRFVKGQTPWNKGEHINKVCPRCATSFSVRPSLDRVMYCSRSCARLGKPGPMKGRTASPETRAKQRAVKLGLRGEGHWNWRGGLKNKRKLAMNRDEYRQWRIAVFERDGYTCQECGKIGCELHADHILSWSAYPEKRFDVSNGRALCVPCHCKTPNFPPQLIPKELRNWSTT